MAEATAGTWPYLVLVCPILPACSTRLARDLWQDILRLDIAGHERLAVKRQNQAGSKWPVSRAPLHCQLKDSAY